MKPGKEYEQFIYEKLKLLFAAHQVTINDKILGQQSNIRREIDVSVRGIVNDIDFLYIVQCKDHNRPADVKIIGEFSAVIKDVGASKGFLVCTEGFAKTIRHYATTLGIELITIEDIKSEKWKVEIEIPVIYNWKDFQISFSFSCISTPELAEKNKVDLVMTSEDIKYVSINGGKSSLTVIDYISSIIESERIDVFEQKTLVLDSATLRLYFFKLWIPTTITVNFIPNEKFYLKYVRPDEYTQLTNHINSQCTPLQIEMKITAYDINDCIEIAKDSFPIKAPVFLVIEENIYPINTNKFTFGGFIGFSVSKRE